MGELDGMTVVVAGAGREIGRAIAEVAAAQGGRFGQRGAVAVAPGIDHIDDAADRPAHRHVADEPAGGAPGGVATGPIVAQAEMRRI